MTRRVSHVQRGEARTSPQCVCGWKEIAQYLSRGVRTMQRYERMYGLPVRRPSGGTRTSVIATKAELDAWIAASPLRRTLHLQTPRFTGMAALREGIAETRRLREALRHLREETHRLHCELQESIAELQKTVNGIHVDRLQAGPKDKNWIV